MRHPAPSADAPNLTAYATVTTDRARRYLVQLCRHLDEVSRLQPHMRARIEWSEDRGVIDLGWGRCTLRAEPHALTMRAEASDETGLQRLQQRIAARLEQIGRRDRLTVTWTPPRNSAGEPTDA